MLAALVNDAPHPLTRFARLALLTTTEGMAVILGLTSVRLGNANAELLSANRYPAGLRTRLVLAIALWVGLVGLGLGWLFWRKRQALLGRLERWSRRLVPVLPLATVPTLLETKYWFAHPIDFLLALAVVSLFAERAFRSSLATFERPFEFGPWRRLVAMKRAPLYVVLLASASYVAYTGYLTVLQHWRFGTGAYDLAIFDNMMWNALHGEPFRSSVMFGDRPGNALADHAHFGMLLFLPVYAIAQRAETLLLLQALVLGAAAVPLYLFAATQISRWAAATIAACYLLSPLLHGAQFYDFHWLPLAVFFHFLLFYGLAKEKLGIILPSVLVLFSLREDVAPGLAVLGLYLLLSGHQAKLGGLLAVSASVWFVLVKFVIMPWAGTWWFADMYKELVAPGEKGFGSILRTLLINPLFVLRTMLTQGKFEYFLHVFVPLLFLPWRNGRLALLTVPGFFFTILTTWSAAYSLKYQYTTHFLPYVFGATVLFLRMAERGELPNRPFALLERPWIHARAALLAMVLAVTCHSAVFGAVLYPSSWIGWWPIQFSMTSVEAERLGQLRSLIARIPRTASVTATDIEAPHLSNRRDLFAIAQDQTAGEYLLVNPTSFHLARTRENVRAVVDRHAYGFVAKAGRMTLWKKNTAAAVPPAIQEAEMKRLRQELKKH